MKEITKEFLTHLFSYGELELPGLGQLILKKEAAKRRLHENKIYGPRVQIAFHADTSKSHSGLSHILSKKWGKSPKKANKKILEHCTFLMSQILNINEAIIPNLGRFYKDDEGHLHFETNPELNNIIQEQYPDLQIKLAQKKEKEKMWQPPPTFSSKYEKEEKIGWFFPLLALVATSLLFACLITCFLQEKYQNKQGVTTESRVTITKDSSQMDSLVEETTADNQNIDYDPFSDADEIIEPDFDDPALYEDSNTDYVEEAKINNENNTNFQGIESLSLDEILQVSAKKRLNISSPCMIVVGSYQRRDLLDKMVNTLQQMDHDIYIEKYGSFYRTSVLFNCEEKDPIIFLKEIRQQVEQKAWLLKH